MRCEGVCERCEVYVRDVRVQVRCEGVCERVE